MSDGLTELPVGWKWTDLGTISEIIMGQSPPGDSYNQSGIGTPLINGPVEFGSEPFSKTVKSKFTTAPTKLCKTDDLILCVRGSTTGRMNIAGFDACIGRGVAAIRSYADQNYLNVFIDSQREDIYRLGTGSTFPNVSAEVLSKIDVPLPPLNEQKRIVAKIEELRDRSHRAKQALEAIPELCDRFRQSVLAAAFRGDLTADWREENPDIEPAFDTLKQAHLSRTREYEQLCTQAKAEKARKPKIPIYLDYNFENCIELPDNIPESWIRTPIGFLCDCIVPGRDKPKSFSGSIPWITIPDITSDVVEASSAGLGLSEDEIQEVSARIIPPNSVIMSCVGRFGISAITKHPIVINQQLHAFLESNLILPKYLMYHIRSLTDYMSSIATATTVSYLNKSNCNSLPINLPPVPEQEEIVTKIEVAFTKISSVEQQYYAAENQLDYLNQSILAKAFRGELVEQDPNDEPASVLLDRIRAERQAQEGKKSGGTRGKQKKVSSDQMDLPGMGKD